MKIVFKTREFDTNSISQGYDQNSQTISFSCNDIYDFDDIKEFFSNSQNLLKMKILNSSGDIIFISDSYVYLQHLEWQFPDKEEQSNLSITLCTSAINSN